MRDHPVWKPNKSDLAKAKSVVIIDDICDTGATFKKLKEELTKEFPKLDVRFACLHYNRPSSFAIDWYGSFIDKEKQDLWLVYPWEDWWERDAVENTIVNDIIGRMQ